MKPKKPRIDRETALSGRPERVPPARCEERPNGGLLVTVRFKRRRLLPWLGGSDTATRSFGLDALGREVYEACDGKTDVTGLIRRFQRAHKVTIAEAELAVTTFLKMLIAKGLVVIAVDKDRIARSG